VIQYQIQTVLLKFQFHFYFISIRFSQGFLSLNGFLPLNGLEVLIHG